jgi:hypothetical protein
MAEASRIDFDDSAPIAAEEDEETLAAIDEGTRDAEAGRVIPIEEVRKLLPQWIAAFLTRFPEDPICGVVHLRCSNGWGTSHEKLHS